MPYLWKSSSINPISFNTVDLGNSLIFSASYVSSDSIFTYTRIKINSCMLKMFGMEYDYIGPISKGNEKKEITLKVSNLLQIKLKDH